jgi:hypothetical protein
MTTRKLQSPTKGSTQDFIEIESLHDDVVKLKDGSCVLLVEVAAVNFWLLAGEEQSAIISAFASFLNSLSFPIQILILSKKMNISHYLDVVEKKKETTTNSRLATLLSHYHGFIKNIVKKNTILEKRFFCVVPFSPLELGASGLNLKNTSTTYIVTRAKTSLYPKRDHLLRILSRAGLTGKVLQSQEIAELFFNLYNPSSSGREIGDVGNYTQTIHQVA